MKNDFNYLLNTCYELNQEIKNLISSINDDDEIRKEYHENKVKTLLRLQVDELNMSKILPEYILQLKFAKRYNFSNKDPIVSPTNFLIE